MRPINLYERNPNIVRRYIYIKTSPKFLDSNIYLISFKINAPAKHGMTAEEGSDKKLFFLIPIEINLHM